MRGGEGEDEAPLKLFVLNYRLSIVKMFWCNLRQNFMFSVEYNSLILIFILLAIPEC